MLNLRRVTFVVTLLCAAPSAAADKVLLLDRSLIDNARIFGPGTHTITSPIVIPKTDGNSSSGTWPYTNPANEICGVFGLGATTSIVSCTNTPPYGPAGTGYLITTENYGTFPVYTAEVSGITLKGPDNYDMGQFPYVDPTQDPESMVGIRLDAVEAIVDNCQIRLIRGPAVRFICSANSGYWLKEYRVSNCRIQHCYVGIEARTDGRYNDNIVSNVRDYCLHLPTNVGSVQSTGNHYYGAQKAIYVVNGEGLHSTNDVFSDAQYGLHLTGYSHYATVTNGYSQHCSVRNIDAESNYNSFVNCSIRVQQEDDDNEEIVGVEFACVGNQFVGGSVYVSAYPYPGATHNTVPVGGTGFLFTKDGYDTYSPRDNRVQTTMVSSTGQGGTSYSDIAVRFADAGQGNQIDITIPYGFYHSNTRLLVIDDGAQSGMKSNTITFRGKNLGNAVSNPGDYVDIGTGGIDSTNSVTITDTTTGASVTLTPGQSY